MRKKDDEVVPCQHFPGLVPVPCHTYVGLRFLWSEDRVKEGGEHEEMMFPLPAKLVWNSALHFPNQTVWAVAGWQKIPIRSRRREVSAAASKLSPCEWDLAAVQLRLETMLWQLSAPTNYQLCRKQQVTRSYKVRVSVCFFSNSLFVCIGLLEGKAEGRSAVQAPNVSPCRATLLFNYLSVQKETSILPGSLFWPCWFLRLWIIVSNLHFGL